MFFIGEKDYSEYTRSTSDMFKRFDMDREKIVQLLKEDPDKLATSLWKHDSPISKDEECLFHMGRSLALSIEDILEKKSTTCDSLINFYVCPQCKNMKRIIEFHGSKRVRANEPFMLECGENAGSSLYYQEVPITRLNVVKECTPYSVKRAYANPFLLDIAKCSSASCAIPSKEAGDQLLKSYLKVNYLGSDLFTNNMLINFYLSSLNPHVLKTSISFVCNENGYNINEYLDIGTIQDFQEYHQFLDACGKPSPTSKPDDKAPISKEVVKSIILQLFACLHDLRKYDFSHGSPSTETIKFKKTEISYIHDGVLISGPITLKLLDFSTSGCTVLNDKKEKSLRLYSKSVVADEELKKQIYKPVIETVSLNNKNDKVTIYKVNKNVKCSMLFLYMKHLGLPVYAASFDAYSFLTVLMTERSFYSTMLNDASLSKLWRSMWISAEDYEKVNERIKEFHENSKTVVLKDVMKILTDLSLRCDMIDFGWSIIKSF